MDQPKRSRSGKHKTPRAATYVEDAPLAALARAAFKRNREAAKVPRTAADLATMLGLSMSTIRFALHGRRRCTFVAQLAAALEMTEAEVQAAADATWALRPEGAGHG